PLGVEQVERVDAAGHDAELGCGSVEIDRARFFRMQAADIDDELTVDENPNVVVTLEQERLAAAVLEARVELGREAEVVLSALFAGSGVSEAGVVERVEKQALEREDVAAL